MSVKSIDGISGIAMFDTMTRGECIVRWRRMFGHTPPKYTSVQFMRKALAFEAQVRQHGGHSKAVQCALKRTLKGVECQAASAGSGSSNGVPRRLAQTPVLKPGSHLVREWNGRSYQVEVGENVFIMDGKRYRSLSSIARKITGAHWSGPRFFGLVKAP